MASLKVCERCAHHLDQLRRLLRKALRHLVEPRAHHLLQADGEIGEFVVHMLGLEIEAGGEPVARRGDGGGRLVAGRFQAVEQSRAALGERIDHGIAGVAERQRDVLALFGERAGDALRHFVDLVGDQIADRGDVVGEIEMHAGNGAADLFGLADQGLALMHEFRKQLADAHFVVVIGALERGDLVVHQRFQLGGAGERALDTVAHGGDFAADGVADGDDLFARGAFRLHQPHRHFGHGFGNLTHVLGAAEHVRQHVEEDDRQRDGADDADRGCDAEARGGEQGLQIATEEIGDGDAAGGPGGRNDAGENVRGARGPAAQRLQNLSDAGAVVIGGARQAGLIWRPVGGLPVVVEQVGTGGRGNRGIGVGAGSARTGAPVGLADTDGLVNGGG